MAVHFDDNSTDRILYSGIGTDFDNLTALTVSAWVRLETGIGNSVVVSKTDFSSDKSWGLFWSNVDGDYDFEIAYDDTNDTDLCGQLNSTTANVWRNVVGVWSPTTRNVYHNGVAGTADTDTRTSISDSAVDLIIANFESGATSQTFAGDIAEIAIWNIDLSEAGTVTDIIIALRAGANPQRIRRTNMIFYVPLFTTDFINDLSGAGYLGTLNGTPTNSNSHPPVQPPFGFDLPVPLVAAAVPPATGRAKFLPLLGVA